MGLLDRLRSRLGRTREKLSDGITGLFRGGRPVDQALLDVFEELLYDADLGPGGGSARQRQDRDHAIQAFHVGSG